MISAFKVLWKTIKDLFEDMLLLILMNIVTLICGVPLFAAIGLPIYLSLMSQSEMIPAVIIALVLAIPAALPFGGALFGLYTVCNRTANGFAISWEHYFSTFKRTFWKAWIYVAFANTVGLLIGINFLWYPRTFPNQDWVPWVMGLWLAVAFFWVAVQFYVIPFYIEQEVKSFRIAVKNAALVAGANPLFTLLLLVFSLALLAVSTLVIAPLFVLGGVLFWVLPGTEGAVNRIAVYRARMEAEESKKQGKPTRNRSE